MDSPELQLFLKDAQTLATLKRSPRSAALQLYEYPFDHELLSLSPLYRESRLQYLELGGRYSPRISSTMRSLSAQDLFADDIDYTPAATELTWFVEYLEDVYDPEQGLTALQRYNTTSVFHEQNHRIIWRLLPPAPREERAFTRYLNFAESLVVMLDLALGDEIGAKLSPVFERMKVTYRTGRAARSWNKSKADNRRYLLAMLYATYLLLELVNPEDIQNAVDFVIPGQKAMNRDAVSRALDISEHFVRITNPQWQDRHWKTAQKKLAKIHAEKSAVDALHIPSDPLDLEEEFVIARSILAQFGL